MSEQIDGAEYGGPVGLYDQSLAEAALGYELGTCAPGSTRAVIMERSITAVTDMKERMLQLIRSQDIEVPQEDIDSWKPGERELQQLQDTLRNERKAVRMMDGLGEFGLNKVEMGKLRSHQREALGAIYDFLEKTPPDEQGRRSGYLDMPTGSGKTATFATLTKALKSNEDPKDPVKVLVVVPTTPILNQTLGRDGKRGFGKFAKNLDVGAYYQKEQDLGKDVTVITNASFNMLIEQGRMPRYDAVLFDEAHTDLGENISANIVDYCRDKLSIGFTATPDYHSDKMVSQLLDKQIYQLPLHEAINRGILCPVTAKLEDANVEIDEASLPEDRRERSFAIRKALFKARAERAIEIAVDEIVRNKAGVVIRCPGGDNVYFAREFAKMLQEKLTTIDDGKGLRNIRAMAVGGRVTGKDDQELGFDQEVAFKLFDEGEVDAFSYVDLLTMGWDSPRAKVFINLAPTTSRVVMTQGIGRVLRPYQHDRKWLEARVYDFKANEKYEDSEHQYTALDALESKQGERVGRGSTTAQRDPFATLGSLAEVAAAEVAYSEVEEVGSVEIRPTGDHSEETDLLTADDVAANSRLPLSRVKEIFEEVGHDPDTPINNEDLEVLVELYPELVRPEDGPRQEGPVEEPDAPVDVIATDDKTPTPEPEPEQPAPRELYPGLIAVSQVVELTGYRKAEREFVKILRIQGVELRRLPDENGKRVYYIARDVIDGI